MPALPTDPLLIDVEGHEECLLGNEAIVRGALEAGVAFASGYPGTPSSEVTDSFARVAGARGIQFEYSVNEKIALEVAFGASLAGARSICAMKHLGLMYAGDPLSTIPYIGAVGGLVIVSAGDPSCRTSPNEQDQRHLAPMLHLPMLDPSTPQQAYAMTRFAFELSEKSSLPVILRPTTRVCHSRAVIRYGRLMEPVVEGFVRDPRRFVPIPVNARRLRRDLAVRVARAGELMEKAEIFNASGSGKLAIAASGAPAATCADYLQEAGLADQVLLLDVGGVYPLPNERLRRALAGVERLLVVEELSPYLEDALRALCAQHELHIQVLGKRTGHFPEEFEYDPDLIARAIHDGLGIGTPPPPPRSLAPVPPRPPTLCPGCPHRGAQFAARTVFGDDTLYFNDIGCYTLGYGPPLNTADAVLCMGAAFTLAAGVARITGKRTVGILGDSTFFHSGMPALLNAVKEEANMVALILDNQVTAMTGFQESPFVELAGECLTRQVSIAAVARALGARQVEVVDPYDLPATIAALERARDAKGVSVVIAERPCRVFLARETHTPYKIATYAVDHSVCQTCGRERLGLRCEQELCEGCERALARGSVSRLQTTGGTPTPREPLAPCSVQCPVGLCIQGYIGQIAAGRWRQAYDMIISQLPLPDSTCRVCHRPCEQACVRVGVDRAVAVNDLKRFIMDWARREKIPYDPPRAPPCDQQIAVIGAGPAGLAAAHDLTLRGFQVTIFDAGEQPGGLLRTGIPAYRLPPEVLQADIERILGLGIQFRGNRMLGRDLRLRELLAEGYAAVFLAMGAPQSIGLRLEGEGDEGSPEVVDALGYLEASNLGLPVSTAKRVIVIGGGNSALDAARTARRRGADRVAIAYRRSRTEMPGLANEVEAAEQEGVELCTLLQPVRLEPGGLICIRTELGAPDDSGRRRPTLVAGSEFLLEADQVLVAIGQAPDPSILDADDLGLELATDGSVRIDHKTCQTSAPRIFAGGDLVPGHRTVTDAIAMGKRAAWGIDRFLGDEERANQRLPPPLYEAAAESPPRGIRPADEIPRQHPAELIPGERITGFTEVVSPLSESQALAESYRCLSCGLCGNCRSCIDLFGCPAFFVEEGAIQIDPNLCMGCGVCAALCPNGAIREVRPTTEVDATTPALGPSEVMER